MQNLRTAWGELRANYVSTGPCGVAGEIHIEHDGELFRNAGAVHSVVGAFRGASIIDFTRTHLVLKSANADLEATASAVMEAIATKAARINLSPASSHRRATRDQQYVNSPSRR